LKCPEDERAVVLQFLPEIPGIEYMLTKESLHVEKKKNKAEMD